MSQTNPRLFTNIIALSNQYKQLDSIRNDLHGLYILPREKDIYTWDGIIFVSTDLWEEGIFKFTLQVPNGDLNSNICVFKFITPVYHPFVNPRTNTLDIQYIYPQWRTEKFVIGGILTRVVQMFHETTFDINLCPNAEAAKYFNKSTDDVTKKVLLQNIRKCVDNSIKTRFDRVPGSSLVFGKPNDTDYDSFNEVKNNLHIE